MSSVDGMPLAPIALFVYNRPDHLRSTLAALAANNLAASSELVIFSDGARDRRDEPAVAAVRGIAREVSGFASIRVVERAANAGLVRSITEGVSQLVAEYGRVIVLEDDLVTAPRFLEFMNLALDRYLHQPEVMQVSGYMYPVDPPSDGRAAFLPATSCWGWATWERSWRDYDSTLQGLDQLVADPVRRRAFNLDGAYDYVGLLNDHRAGRVNSWGVVWHLSVFLRNGLTLYPATSLVSNEGFDGSGVHGQPNNLGQAAMDMDDVKFAWPERIETNQQIYAAVKQLIRGSKKGWQHWLRSLLGD